MTQLKNLTEFVWSSAMNFVFCSPQSAVRSPQSAVRSPQSAKPDVLRYGTTAMGVNRGTALQSTGLQIKCNNLSCERDIMVANKHAGKNVEIWEN